ncbi:MAG TPA: ATP12 family protein [Sphingomonadaceae bacterium]
MKRFYEEVAVESVERGWRVLLDGRAIKTARGAPQMLPTQPLAETLAGEWRGQGDRIDPAGFPLRDLADYAIDVVAPDPAAAVAAILRFAESDTLCYRADPDEPLHARQRELWEPLLSAAETRHAVRFERASGIIHRAQPPETLRKLGEALAAFDPFTLAALNTLASLAASLVIALTALDGGADAEALWAAANCEEDWQAEQWGWEWTAEERRAKRLGEFSAAMRFARLSVTEA